MRISSRRYIKTVHVLLSRFIIHLFNCIIYRNVCNTQTLISNPFCNMAPCSFQPKTPAPAATSPGSPNQELPSKDMKIDNEMIVNAIRGLLAARKKDTSLTESSQPSVCSKDNMVRFLDSTEAEQSSRVAKSLKLYELYRREMAVAPDVPRDDSSELVTVNQLIRLLESALEPKRFLDIPTTERAGTEQGDDNTRHG